MAFDLIWSPTARRDLKGMKDTIAEESPLTAERFTMNILHAVERLSDYPQLGRIVPEFEEPSIRELIYAPYRIVYRVKRDKGIVEIVRVWHAARGIPEVADHPAQGGG